MAPPNYMQVLVPSIRTKPAPYSAHEFADLAPFSGSTLPEVAALSDRGIRGCSANLALAGKSTATITSRDFRIPRFTAPRRSAPDQSVCSESLPGLDPGWEPVRVMKTRQNKNLESRSD
jgi:hypothetical protein